MIVWRDRLRTMLRTQRFWSMVLSMTVLSSLCVYLLMTVFRDDTSVPTWDELLARISPAMFLTTGLIYTVILTLAVIGWGWIIGMLSGNWQWSQHARIYCLTTITRRIPGTIWYLVGRIVMYERLQVPRSLTAIATGLEFAAIVLGGLLVAVITWPFVFNRYDISPLWFVGGLMVGVLLFNPVILRTVIRRLHPQSETLSLCYRSMMGWILLYAGIWVGGGVILFVLTRTVHPTSGTMLPVIIGIWATAGVVATLLSFIPMGLGQELTLTALLSPFVGPAEAIIIALFMRGVLTLNEVVWAIIAGLVGLRELSDLFQNGPYGRIAVNGRPEHSDAKKPEEVYDCASILPHK
jgi:hypothetical protein